MQDLGFVRPNCLSRSTEAVAETFLDYFRSTDSESSVDRPAPVSLFSLVFLFVCDSNFYRSKLIPNSCLCIFDLDGCFLTSSTGFYKIIF